MVTGRRPPRAPIPEDEQPKQPVEGPLVEEREGQQPEQVARDDKPDEQPPESEQPAPRYAEGAATMMSQTRIGPQTRADLSEMMRKALEEAQAAGKSVEEQGQAVRDAVARYNAGED